MSKNAPRDRPAADGRAELERLAAEVPASLRERFAEITDLLDACCEERLNDDYRLLCREMAAAICQPGSPVMRGKAGSWAAGTLYVLGQMNFLTDRSQTPHMTSGEIAAAFDVSPATMHNKAKTIREGLDLSHLDPTWQLPDRLERHPMRMMADLLGPADRRGRPVTRTEPREPVGEIEALEYDITEEPWPDPHLDAMSPEEREEFEEVGAAITAGGGEEALDRVAALLDRFPDYPTLHNFHAVALQSAGRDEEATRVIEETARRFPDYLFGRLNLAGQLIQRGEPEGVPAVFDGQMALARLYPERNGRFHVSEFVAFHTLLGEYFAALGDLENAEIYLELVEDVAPDHPSVIRLADRLDGLAFADTLASLTERFGRAKPAKAKRQKKKKKKRRK